MEYLTDLYADLEDRIDQICAIGDINKDILTIAVDNLKFIKKELVDTGRNLGIITKVDRQLAMYGQVSRLPQVGEKLPIIREQMVVLLVGALEVFLADIFRRIANENPEYFQWNDPKEKISFDPALLEDGFTLGDAILGHLKNKGFNFQDLQSSLRALETYCQVTIVLDDQLKDELILAAAYRHVIVHNKAEIDTAFLNQIRDTSFLGRADLVKGEHVSISEAYVMQLAERVAQFAQDAIVILMQRQGIPF